MTPPLVHEISALCEHIQTWRTNKQKIAFVPTMGNLHAGHLKLVSVAAKHADKVLVSIFVNPLQFGPGEDYDNYPRTLTADCDALSAYPADLVFAPSVEAIYPQQQPSLTLVSVPELSHVLCGKSRPHFFAGVCTVVAKFFNLIQPDVAVFGEKDFQQLCVIRQMVADLCYPIEIIGVPTQRGNDNLALSSRNQYLTPEERAIAPKLIDVLTHTKNAILHGQRDYPALTESAKRALTKVGFKPDYVDICRVSDLRPATEKDTQLVICAAAFLGAARLIDNVHVDLALARDCLSIRK